MFYQTNNEEYPPPPLFILAKPSPFTLSLSEKMLVISWSRCWSHHHCSPLLWFPLIFDNLVSPLLATALMLLILLVESFLFSWFHSLFYFIIFSPYLVFWVVAHSGTDFGVVGGVEVWWCWWFAMVLDLLDCWGFLHICFVFFFSLQISIHGYVSD